ncbi:MAG: DNA polymerase III subunit gamma/tau [Deltaproteobacteria bacterium]|nr:DNA polymerase III subunit gamma/tau [Deltaproteobacteria bacterium]
MSYTVLARKYRPQTFASLVGQEHVTRTLGNAIESGRVAHAFLFTGVRGIGKTTAARLLAKALNCQHGPAKEPCNQCPPCREIALGTNLDVQEIDGASNNSVEDVRRLQETLPFRPARDRYKIVIVDEVHMLSIGAFNAFLKTLEEPPEHVKFIFATTENHKVPLTIRSRCQRYDFRLIPNALIAERIREILRAESIEADDATVSIVTRQAAGSMRDALTVLDQVVAFGGAELRADDVARCLGIADRALVFEIAAALLEANSRVCLSTVTALAEQGLDMLHFTRQLLELMRDLVVLRVAGADNALVDLAGDELELAKKIVEARTPQEIERTFTGLSKLMDDVARSNSPKIVLEMGLVRLADRPPLKPIGELIAKLEALQNRLSGGSGSSQRGSDGRGDAPYSGKFRGENEGSAKKLSQRPGIPTVQIAQRTATPRDTSSLESTEAVENRGGSCETGKTAMLWNEIVALLNESRPALAAVLEHGVPVEISEEFLKIAFREGSFFGRQVQDTEAQNTITSIAERVLGKAPRLQLLTVSQPESLGVSIVQKKILKIDEVREKGMREATNHPKVQEAIAVFPEAKDNIHIDVELEESTR